MRLAATGLAVAANEAGAPVGNEEERLAMTEYNRQGLMALFTIERLQADDNMRKKHRFDLI